MHAVRDPSLFLAANMPRTSGGAWHVRRAPTRRCSAPRNIFNVHPIDLLVHPFYTVPVSHNSVGTVTIVLFITPGVSPRLGNRKPNLYLTNVCDLGRFVPSKRGDTLSVPNVPTAA